MCIRDRFTPIHPPSRCLSAMRWSLQPTLWSLDILRIDLVRVIFQKSVVGILYGYSIFSTTSYRVIDAWYSEFLIIGLLYYAQYYQGFLYLQYSVYSRRAIKDAVQREFYCKAVLSDQYYLTSFEDLYSRKCRRCQYSDYCSVDLRALSVMIHI